MHALKRIPWHKRSAKAREWAYKSHESRRANTLARGPDKETAYRRALDDARGQIEHHGMSYSADKPEGEPWFVIRSKEGNVNQVDVITGNRVSKPCGLRTVERGMKRAKL